MFEVERYGRRYYIRSLYTGIRVSKDGKPRAFRSFRSAERHASKLLHDIAKRVRDTNEN